MWRPTWTRQSVAADPWRPLNGWRAAKSARVRPVFLRNSGNDLPELGPLATPANHHRTRAGSRVLRQVDRYCARPWYVLDRPRALQLFQLKRNWVGRAWDPERTSDVVIPSRLAGQANRAEHQRHVSVVSRPIFALNRIGHVLLWQGPLTVDEVEIALPTVVAGHMKAARATWRESPLINIVRVSVPMVEHDIVCSTRVGGVRGRGSHSGEQGRRKNCRRTQLFHQPLLSRAGFIWRMRHY